MTAMTAVQLLDGSGKHLQNQYYDPTSDTYKPGDPALSGVVAVTTLATPTIAAALPLAMTPCKLFGLSVCATNVAGYLMLFDAVAAPADGTVTPKRVWPVAINTALEIGFVQPVRMLVGAVLVFSSTGPFNLTRSASAFISCEVQNG